MRSSPAGPGTTSATQSGRWRRTTSPASSASRTGDGSSASSASRTSLGTTAADARRRRCARSASGKPGRDEQVRLMSVYADRHDAGRALAAALAPRYAGEPGVAVLALPRGGVPVGFEVARRFETPLDVLVVRKLGMPGQEELAIGAVAS